MIINLPKICTSCSWRNTNSKYCNKIWQFVKLNNIAQTCYSLLLQNKQATFVKKCVVTTKTIQWLCYDSESFVPPRVVQSQSINQFSECRSLRKTLTTVISSDCVSALKAACLVYVSS